MIVVTGKFQLRVAVVVVGELATTEVGGRAEDDLKMRRKVSRLEAAVKVGEDLGTV